MTDVSSYCREVEAHLCRKNGGHLIRVVGPAFDLVKGWAELGIPLSVVQEGIDRTIARAARAARRRRPVPIAFCEGDVLDGFDRWKRAVGVAAAPSGPTDASARRGTLAGHVERAAAQLSAWRPATADPALARVVSEIAAALAGLVAASAAARGAARDELLATLAELDRTLVEAAAASLSADRLEALGREGAGELDAYRGRLSAEQWTAALASAHARAVRRETGLPSLAFD